MMGQIRIPLTRRELAPDRGGHNVWHDRTETRALPAAKVAAIVCDMWDGHWSRGAAERVDAMAPQMDALLAALRDAGALIIHAPSDTMDFYADAPARKRALSIPLIQTPPDAAHADPPLPFPRRADCSDTNETVRGPAWSRQHAAIGIDQERDLITDDGARVWAALRAREIGLLLVMGVHTNICILNRSFAIKQMVRWGQPVALVRDMTDALYNPANAPYVSHDDGTRLVCDHIAAHWCPTTTSASILAGLGA